MNVVVGIIVYLAAAYLFFMLLRPRFKDNDAQLAHGLLYWHLLLSAAYYLYAL